MPKDTTQPRFPFSCWIAVELLMIAAAALNVCRQAPAQEQTTHTAGPASASVPDAPTPQTSSSGNVTIHSIPRDLLHDQEAIWTSPARIRAHDLAWLLPLAAATGIAFATDRHTMTDVVSHDPSFNQASIDTSNALIGGMIAVPVAVYGFGLKTQDDHARQAGVLTGESMVDGVVVEEALKLVSWRERPNVDDARGRFFQSNVGADSSFPSSHSIIAWSAASALAAEYSAPWKQFALYSAATGVSLTRVMAQQHFPSDVLVGSSLGWLIGHNVVRRHHKNRQLGSGNRE